MGSFEPTRKREDVKEYIIKDKSKLERLDELMPITGKLLELVSTKNVKVIISEDTLMITSIE